MNAADCGPSPRPCWPRGKVEASQRASVEPGSLHLQARRGRAGLPGSDIFEQFFMPTTLAIGLPLRPEYFKQVKSGESPTASTGLSGRIWACRPGNGGSAAHRAGTVQSVQFCTWKADCALSISQHHTHSLDPTHTHTHTHTVFHITCEYSSIEGRGISCSECALTVSEQS